MAGGWEPGHVASDLAQDDLRGAGLDAGDRAQQLDRRSQGRELLADGVGEPVDLPVQEVDVGEDRADPERVV
jgi:hypothetical protein